jgi:hypothetical protein
MRMHKKFWLLSALLLTLALPLTVMGQDPKEDDEAAKEIAKNSGLWFLKFSHDGPRWISMNNDLGVEDGKIPHEFSGSAKQLRAENYWYVFYTITNKEQADHRLFINVTAESDKNKNVLSKRTKMKKGFASAWDKFRVRDADQKKAEDDRSEASKFRSLYRKRYHDVKDPAVFKKVEAILRYRGKLKKDEKLHSQIDLTIPAKPDDLGANPATRKLAMAMIKAGETKKCVAIFRKFDVEMDWLILNFRGLSNDQVIDFPEDYRREVTENVFQLLYKRHGSDFFTANKTPKFLAKRWVAVKRTIKTDLKSPKDE